MQPIYVQEPVDVAVNGTDLYLTLPDGMGTIVMPVHCGFRLGVRMLDALAGHYLGLPPSGGTPHNSKAA